MENLMHRRLGAYSITLLLTAGLMGATAPADAIVAEVVVQGTLPVASADDVADDEADLAGSEPELSTPESTTDVVGAGEVTLESLTSPVNYMTTDGSWEPIENELVEPATGAYAARSDGASWTAKLPDDASATPVRFTTAYGWVTMKMRGLDEAPVVDGSEATYTEVRNADSVIYEVSPVGLKESIVLKAAPSSPVAFVYDLRAADGLTARMDAGEVVFEDSAGIAAISIPVGSMFDSADPSVLSDNVKYALAVGSDGGWRLTVTPSFDWLTDATRVYPVVVDPTLSDARVRNGQACFIQSYLPNDSACLNTYLRVGRSDSTHRYRTLLNFDLSSIPKNATISYAKLELYLDASKTLDSSKVTDYAVFPASTHFGKSATWNSSGGWGPWTGGSPSGGGHGTAAMGGGTSGVKTFYGLANLVQGWVTNPDSKVGMLLKQTVESTNNVLYFYSDTADASRRPRLTVNYTVPVPNDPSCSGVVLDGNEPDAPSSSLPPEQLDAMYDEQDLLCYSFPTAPRCTTDPSIYEGEDCLSEEEAWGDFGKANADDLSDQDPAIRDALYSDELYRTCPTRAQCWIPGPVVGPKIRVPTGSVAWAGQGLLITGVAVLISESIQEMLELITEMNVPVPREKSTPSDWALYEVYGKKSVDYPFFKTWKWGITRVQPYADRAKKALPNCNQYMWQNYTRSDSCTQRILKTGLSFYLARIYEGAYCARYVALRGHRPPGMEHCR